jgi:hypothetical protein
MSLARINLYKKRAPVKDILLEVWGNHFQLKTSEKMLTYVIFDAGQLSNDAKLLSRNTAEIQCTEPTDSATRATSPTPSEIALCCPL